MKQRYERMLQGGIERGYGTDVVPEFNPDLLFSFIAI